MSKDQLRQAMPTVAAIVDEYRHLMANGGKLIYASENGHVIDRREPEDESKVFNIPERYGNHSDGNRIQEHSRRDYRAQQAAAN